MLRPSKIPGRLRRKVPSALLMFVDGRRFMTIFGLGLALFGIYGPVAGPPSHDGLRYLLLSLLCPALPTLYYKLRPVQPYSGYRGRWGDLGPMIGKDERDAEARQLRDLMRSAEAQGAMTRIGVRMAVILFVPMAIASAVLWPSLSWTLWSQVLFMSLVLGMIGCWIAVFAQLIGWGVTTWAARAGTGNG